MSKFEKKALKKINLTEGFLKLILRTLTASAFEKALRNAEKASDENLKAAGIDLEAHTKEYARAIRAFCKEWPKDPICKK